MATDDGTTPDPNESEEGTEDAEGEENEGGEETPTLEEVIAERDALQARLDRQRTQKAREARAANRKKNDPKPKGDEENPLQAELDEAKATNKSLELRLNMEQAKSIAAELGFSSPATGARLVDWDTMVDPSDEDEVRDALRDVLKENPGLKKQAAKADGGEGGDGTSGGRRSFNDIIRSAAGRG